MNVLVCNLTRFGDLLQTQPVLLGLQAQGHRVGLLCLNNFASTLPLLRGVDAAFALAGNSLLAKLDSDWRLALAEIDALFHTIQKTFPVDCVCNTTATLASRLLTQRLAPKGSPLLGFGLDDEGFGRSGDVWTTFLQGGSQHRMHCPFNIVDMFRAAAGLRHTEPLWGLAPPDADTRAAALALLQEATPAGTSGYVALQLGASEARRQWPVASFAALGERLWEEDRLCPVLLGSPAETALSAEYMTRSHAPAIDCVGRTSIPQLAGILTHARLLISNDTGTMHLAAGLGCAVLGIFLATAQPWDTGPYAANCCSIEPALPCHPCEFATACPNGLACHAQISVATVFALASGFVRHGVWGKAGSHIGQEIGRKQGQEEEISLARCSDARIWLSDRDAQGFASLTSLSGHDAEARSQALYFQRFFYSHIIDALNGDPAPHAEALSHAAASLPLPADLRHTLCSALQQGADLFKLLAEQSTMALRMPASPAARRILATNKAIERVLEDCRPIGALAFLWRTLVHERGNDLNNIRQMALQLSVSFEQFCKALTASPM